MTTNVNPGYLPPGNPVRELLRSAAAGDHEPTRDQLDTFLIRGDLPEGSDLNRHRTQIVDACRQVRRLSIRSEFQAARELAGDLGAQIARGMTDSERTLDQTTPADKQEPLADIAARMFGR